jgi:hypothetical protein
LMKAISYSLWRMILNKESLRDTVLNCFCIPVFFKYEEKRKRKEKERRKRRKKRKGKKKGKRKEKEKKNQPKMYNEKNGFESNSRLA